VHANPSVRMARLILRRSNGSCFLLQQHIEWSCVRRKISLRNNGRFKALNFEQNKPLKFLLIMGCWWNAGMRCFKASHVCISSVSHDLQDFKWFVLSKLKCYESTIVSCKNVTSTRQELGGTEPEAKGNQRARKSLWTDYHGSSCNSASITSVKESFISVFTAHCRNLCMQTLSAGHLRFLALLM
jgi:hypothetical protein